MVRPHMVSIPLSGGKQMMACASQTLDPAVMSVGQVDAVIRNRKLWHLQHYSGHTHQAAIPLPNFVCDTVAGAGALLMP